MHPLEKIVVLLAFCQIFTLIQTTRHVRYWEDKPRITPDDHILYWIKIGPLLAAIAVLAVLILRIFRLFPWFII